MAKNRNRRIRHANLHASAGFMEKVAKATGRDISTPVAVICASGGRSTVIAPILEKAGYKSIYNVAEGMLGGRYGKGWIPSGLPLKPYGPRR